MEIDLLQLRENFFADAEDHIENMEAALLRLEPDLSDKDAIGELFRGAHSLKGDCGALGFEAVGTLLHEFESTLDKVRDGDFALNVDSVDVLARVIDQIDRWIDSEKAEQPFVEGFAESLSALSTLDAGKAPSGESQATETPTEPADFEMFDEVESPKNQSEQDKRVASARNPFFGDFLVERGLISHEQVLAALDEQRARQPLLGAVLVQSGVINVAQAAATLSFIEDRGVRFGEAASELGYINNEELVIALEAQRRARPRFRKLLIELGILPCETVEAEFDAFIQQHPDAVADEVDLECHKYSPSCSARGSSTVGASESDAGDRTNKVEATDFDADPEILAEFIVESVEHLEIAEEKLLVIETEPDNSEALNAIYRAFHTIKGVSSFLGLEDTRNLAHQAESMLNLARDGKLVLRDDAFEVALASVDGLKRQVGFAEAWLSSQGKLEVDGTLPGLLAAIDAVANGKEPAELPTRSETVEAPTAEDAQAAPKADVASGIAAPRAATLVKESIKVDRDRLDKLINVIGELVIGQAMVEEEIAVWQSQIGHESLAFSQLNKTVRDLQELSLSLRMVPVGSVFHKMARIVRDLGRKLGKEILFETEGEETELDKTVVDQIGDPLLHMVRNAADHGIEPPEDREAAGKPPQGRIVLRAYHQGGNIYIEIEDDGKGLDRDVLLRKAIERRIVSDEDNLSDQEIYNLIFAPGFSTAKQVTDVSGRGVGMDVVRRNVEALQGSVSVTSKKGSGSTVVIRLPLTLAILDGLSIRVENEVYIVPILSVVESFSPEPSDMKRIAAKGEVVMVRGEVVPLLRLADLLRTSSDRPKVRGNQSLVVIVEDQGKKYGLLVDELMGQSQVVIKNLEANYRKVDGIAGATILGDGSIAMIVDVFGLVSLASHKAVASHSDSSSDSASIAKQPVGIFA